MPKLPVLSYDKVIKKMRKMGFRFYRQGKGSHELWVRDKDKRVVPVPVHKGKDIKKGTLRAIIKEMDITVESFLNA